MTVLKLDIFRICLFLGIIIGIYSTMRLLSGSISFSYDNGMITSKDVLFINSQETAAENKP